MDLLMDINGTGDMVFVNGAAPRTYIEADVVAQRLAIHLRTFRAEWFLDKSYGVPWFEILGTKKTKQQVYEFNKEVPDLKNATFNALNRVCDNILFFDVLVDDNGNEERRIYYRDSVSHTAGSSLKFMPEWTSLSAKSYLDAFKEAVEKEGKENTTDQPKQKPTDSENSYDFDSIMKEIAELGKKLQKDGKADERQKVIEEVLGKGRKVKDLDESQAEIASVLVDKLKEIA